ncbi:MAG: hypothetical protein E6H08_13880 [Bacteroidetes bacterium]|nr:MAG: hypothetical protein E6H08_13880 [Bacteroidota bacterium]
MALKKQTSLQPIHLNSKIITLIDIYQAMKSFDIITLSVPLNCIINGRVAGIFGTISYFSSCKLNYTDRSMDEDKMGAMAIRCTVSLGICHQYVHRAYRPG